MLRLGERFFSLFNSHTVPLDWTNFNKLLLSQTALVPSFYVPMNYLKEN